MISNVLSDDIKCMMIIKPESSSKSVSKSAKSSKSVNKNINNNEV